MDRVGREAVHQGEEQGVQEEEEARVQPVEKRIRKQRQFYDSSQAGPQHLKDKKSSPSRRQRKKTQADAKYRNGGFLRSQEPLRTEMKVKEKWLVGQESE